MSRKVVFFLKSYAISCYVTEPMELRNFLVKYDFELIYCDSEEEFLENLPEAEIAITSLFKAEWLPKARLLKWVTTNSAGRELIAVAALEAAGIKVSFARFHGRIMAETVLGMMLWMARGLGIAYRRQKEGAWCDRELLDERVSLLQNKKCMILGLGQIGRYVARLTKAFGMYNLGVKREISQAEAWVDELVPFQDFRNFLPQIDHLVVILPKDPATDEIINKTTLGLMKQTAFLYNVGRGNCINEADLYEVLKEQKIKGAGLDVFQQEPLSSESPLRGLSNVLLLPHASAFAPEYYELYYQEFQSDFQDYFSQKKNF